MLKHVWLIVLILGLLSATGCAGVKCAQGVQSTSEIKKAPFNSVYENSKVLCRSIVVMAEQSPKNKQVLLEACEEEIFIFLDQSIVSSWHCGYQKSGIIYDLGAITGQEHLDTKDLKASKCQLGNSELIRLDMPLSANYIDVLFFEIKDGRSAHCFSVAGPVQIVDIDGDGLMEAVASAGSPCYTSIYKYQENTLHAMDVNKVLGDAQEVVFKHGIFEAHYESDQEHPKCFELQAEQFIEKL